MWIHGIPTSAARCMNSNPTHTKTPVFASALTLLLALSLGEMGEQATQQKPVGTAAAILLQSVCTHTSEQSGGERKETETARDWGGERWNECVCVSVCETVREREGDEREDVILWCPPKHKQSGIVVHMGLTAPSLFPLLNPGLRKMLAGIFCVFQKNNKIKTQLCKSPEASMLERLQRRRLQTESKLRELRCIIPLTPTHFV